MKVHLISSQTILFQRFQSRVVCCFKRMYCNDWIMNYEILNSFDFSPVGKSNQTVKSYHCATKYRPNECFYNLLFHKEKNLISILLSIFLKDSGHLGQKSNCITKNVYNNIESILKQSQYVLQTSQTQRRKKPLFPLFRFIYHFF